MLGVGLGAYKSSILDCVTDPQTSNRTDDTFFMLFKVYTHCYRRDIRYFLFVTCKVC